jgi:hypothetical protein
MCLGKFSLVLLTFLSIQVARAQVQPCTVSEAGSALDKTDTFRSWDALHRSYKEFGSCDDGAVAEGFSESVARIFADHWNTLPRFAQLAENDPSFRAFVIRHIDATLNMDDVEKIKRAALTHCPSGLRKTCSDIAKQADFALKDSASP